MSDNTDEIHANDPIISNPASGSTMSNLGMYLYIYNGLPGRKYGVSFRRDNGPEWLSLPLASNNIGVGEGTVGEIPLDVKRIVVTQEGNGYSTVSIFHLITPVPKFDNGTYVGVYPGTAAVSGYIPLNPGIANMPIGDDCYVDIHSGPDGEFITRFPVAKNGKWSGQLQVPNGRLWITARFKVGTRALSEWASNINIIGLAKPVINVPPDSVVDTRPTISGSNGAPEATISLVESGFGDVVYGSGQVKEDGTWSIQITTPLPARTFNMTCRQSLSTHHSDWATPVTLIVLSAPIITAPSGTTDPGAQAISGTVASAKAGTQIDIYRDATNEILGRGEVNAPPTTWTGTLTNALVPGIHVFSAVQNYYQTLSQRGPAITLRVRPGAVTDIRDDIGQLPTVVFSGKGHSGAIVKFQILGAAQPYEATVAGGTWAANVRMRPQFGEQQVTFWQSLKVGGNEWIDSVSTVRDIHIDTPKPSGTLVIMNGDAPEFSGSYYFFQGVHTGITVFINNAEWGGQTMTADGPWEVRKPTPLPPGTHTVKVLGGSNNQWSVAEELESIVIRPQVPHDTVIKVEGFFARLNGKCWPLATVALLFDDDVNAVVVPSDAQGKWKYEENRAFTPGDHTYKLSQTFGGQTSPVTSAGTFNIATPAVTITVPVGGAPDVSLRPEVEGTGAYVGAVIKVYDAKVNGKVLGEHPVIVAGAWSLTLKEEFLAEGNQALYAVQEFATQESADSDHVSFNARLPKPEVIQPPVGNIPRYAEYSGKGWPLSTITLTRVGFPEWRYEDIPVDGMGNWKASVQLHEVGPQTLAISQQYKTFTRDGEDRTFTVIPNVPLLETPAEGERLTPRPMFAGHGYPQDTVSVVKSNEDSVILGTAEVADDGTWFVRCDRDLPLGEDYLFSIRQARDGFNSGWFVPTRTFHVLTFGPTVDEPVAGDWTGIYPWVGGRDVPGAKITVASLFNAQEVLAPVATVDATGHWRVQLNKPLPEGANWLQARAERPNGQVSDWTRSGRFFCEVLAAGYLAPTVLYPQLGAEVGLQPVLSGGGLPGAEVFVTTPEDTATYLAQATVDREGRWTARFKTPLTPDTEFSYVVRLGRDAVRSANTEVRTFKVVQVPADFEPPTVTSHKNGDVVDQRFWVSGRGRPGARLTLHKQGIVSSWGTTEVDASGHWQVCFVGTLALEEFIFGAQQSLDGQLSRYSTGITVTVAEALPAPILDSPKGETQVAPLTRVCGRGYPQATVTLVKSGDANSNWGCGVVDAKGYWEIWTQPLPLGPIRLNAKQQISGKPDSGWMKEEFVLHAVIAG